MAIFFHYLPQAVAQVLRREDAFRNLAAPRAAGATTASSGRRHGHADKGRGRADCDAGQHAEEEALKSVVLAERGRNLESAFVCGEL